MEPMLELEYDDVQIGHPDLGWMPRDERIFTGKGGYGPADEDAAYALFLKGKGIEATVADGRVQLS